MNLCNGIGYAFIIGSLLIQKQLQFSDRELVEEIRENPYFQYFIGLPGYQDAIPFVSSLHVEFRKRLTAEVLEEINEMIIAYNAPEDPPPTGGGVLMKKVGQTQVH